MIDPINKATFEECRELIFKSSSLIENIQSQIQNVSLRKNPSKPFDLNLYLEPLIENLKLIEQSKIIIENSKLDNRKLIDEARKIRKYISIN